MSARRVATNLRPAAHHRSVGGADRPEGGGVLTQEPSGNRRAGATARDCASKPLSTGESRTFDYLCAAEGVAMRTRFDRIGEVSNWAIYQVFLDRRRDLESLQRRPGGVHPDPGADARLAQPAPSARNFSDYHGFSIPNRAHARAVPRKRSREFADRAWYVDCTAWQCRSVQGEGNQ
jgi:hypothetical protein